MCCLIIFFEKEKWRHPVSSLQESERRKTERKSIGFSLYIPLFSLQHHQVLYFSQISKNQIFYATKQVMVHLSSILPACLPACLICFLINVYMQPKG